MHNRVEEIKGAIFKWRDEALVLMVLTLAFFQDCWETIKR